MIYVTQGHENGVGLEIYLKSLICLPTNKSSNLTLIAYKETITKTLVTLNLKFDINDKSISICGKTINYIQPDKSLNSLPQSSSCLLFALINIKHNEDILLTLPTSKDQLILNNKQENGYTEYLRNYFNCSDLCMSFISPDNKIALISDHISLNSVSSYLTEDVIFNKTKFAIESLKKFTHFKEVLFSGINPHAGENGLIGNEEQVIIKAIKKLSLIFNNINFKGPYPGDTMYFSKNNNEQLLVYMYHDQALAQFKSLNGLIGANITCGLPFIRASVDHGTAFNLFGKNEANYQGCIYLLNLLLGHK